MQPTTKILERIYQNSQNNPDEVFTRIFRYMLRPDIYFLAYKNLYANKGASTPGVDENDTADGFSEEKVNRIIETLKNGSYEPKPVRRTYIKKKNGKQRPLGLPTFTDKLVQEVLRMILEAIYEPIFCKYSHGFRPNRSCHTALNELSREFTGIRWFIEGDIKGCFDNIDHHVLIAQINKKVKDARIIQLLWKFLRAGYLEDWRYNSTYSGTPQGGIVSPLLANIYLHELDKFVLKLKKEFDVPQKQQFTTEYNHARGQVYALSKKLKQASGEQKKEIYKQWKKARQIMLKTPAKSQTDKVIKYVRYADDFLIGVNGNKKECQRIKQQIRGFMAKELHMELSEEKTLITHSNEGVRFLGYDICVRRCSLIKKTGDIKLPKRTLNNKIELNIPFKDKIEIFMFEKGIIGQKETGEIEPIHRKSLLRLTPLEIVQTYNSELRGICNYYCMASNFSRLDYFSYLMEYSCLKTLAAKFRSSIGKIKAKYKDGHGNWGIPYETKTEKKRMYFADYMNCKKATKCTDEISNQAIIYSNTRTKLEERLKARVCELCGSTDAKQYEIHHIHKVKDLKGKSDWERNMIAKRRKTIVVCKECHNKIHGYNVSK